MKKIIYFLFIALALFVTSCELPDNVDPKYSLTVDPEALFTYSEVELVNQVGSINVNINTTRLLAQYQSETTYPTESRYNFSDRQIPDAFFIRLYERVLMNLKDAHGQITASPVVDEETAAVKANKLACIEILNVYAYQILVDAFGNVPYTEALMGAENSRPKYDDAYTIYMDLLSRLDAAIASINEDYDGFANDVLYSTKKSTVSDVPKMTYWKEFAASLKLRMGLRLADVPAANPNKIVTEALATGVYTDQSYSAILTYTGVSPYVNSYYTEFVINARKDFCPTVTLVDFMNTLKDPRRAKWFTLYHYVDEDLDIDTLIYKGEPYGLKAAASYSKYSHFADAIRIDPTYPVILSDKVEVEFLLAEACERGLGGLVPADAETHYNAAVLGSMKYWGVSDADAATYLAQPLVAYTTATGDYKQKIGMQKWLGLFDRGEEAWAEWRRLDYPKFNPPQSMTYADIPLRMPYPYNENKMNKANYDAAVTAMGGDETDIQLFWDKVDSPYLTK